MNLRQPSAPALGGLIARLQQRLNARATPATREWWTKYLRGAASFRGVKMEDIRTAVHTWRRDPGRTVALCGPCHRNVHVSIGNKDLERGYDSVEALRDHPGVRRFTEWVKDKPHGRA